MIESELKWAIGLVIGSAIVARPIYNTTLAPDQKVPVIEETVNTPYVNIVDPLVVDVEAGPSPFSGLEEVVAEKKPYTIVLDPGHGEENDAAAAGYDVGKNHNGVYEADLVLQYVNVAREALEDKGYTVLVTREGNDVPLTLTDRTALGNKHGDVFVSVHANAFTSESAHGFETYWLGRGDSALAQSVHSSLDSAYGDTMRDRGMKTNNYVVLRTSKIPSTLVEVGFVTNDHDREILMRDSELIGTAIADGIDDYFTSK